jgi:single-stranded-DNA-specific exonuclease
MLIKKWRLKDVDNSKAETLNKSLKINPLICQLLVQRGIYNFEEAKNFFRPDIADLHNPFLMKDMDLAVKRIIEAIEKNQKIMIYGDYDVDGTTSVSLLYLFLSKIHSNLEYYIPDRYLEGYGISFVGIDYASSQKIELIIALDCGVTAIDQISYAKERHIDFIICDHHLPGDALPEAVAVLDPKRNDCPYPFKELSGCGVGFKLCSALSERLDIPKEHYLDFIDLVAVSIASDIVPIVGENRILAYYGLKKLNEAPIPGLYAIKTFSGLKDKNLQISDVVFSLGPRINAPGRMAHAKASVEVLISESNSLSSKLAEILNEINSERRSTDELMTGEAIGELDLNLNLQNQKTIVLSSPQWHKGVIGIVASRIVEKYYRPTIIFSEKEEIMTGSARSIKGFSIYQGIKACSSLVKQFGGHDFAAGVSIHKDQFDEFKKQFEDYAQQMITDEMLQPEIEIDLELPLAEVNQKFYNVLSQIGPFGPQNMLPMFVSKNLRDSGGTRKVGSNHIRFELRDENGNRVNGIGFGLASQFDIEELKQKPFDICYHIQENHFRNQVHIDLLVKDIKFA